MSWGQNGVTQKRRLLDQSASVTWGAAATRIPTQAFRQTGYLKRLFIKIPIQAGAIAGTVAVSVQANLQGPAFRIISALDVTAQGIAPFYQITKGNDLKFLQYVGNGQPNSESLWVGSLPDISPSTPVGAFGRLAALFQSFGYQVVTAAPNAGAINVQVSGVYDVPLTEFVRFPEYIVQGQQGPITVPAQTVEVGIVTLQNTQQNVTPHLTLNPLYSGGVNSPFLSGGTAPTGGVSTLVEFYTEFYDVPSDPGNQPPAYSQLFIIQRAVADDGVSGGAVTHTFAPAGLLLRAIYCMYDVNDNLVDFSGQSIQAVGTYPLTAQVQEGVISFAWGSTVFKSTERFSINLIKALEAYADVPPPGALFHDFFVDRTVTDVINTAVLPSVRTIVTGLPAAVTNMHTIEQRMIPVKVG